ncbi:MAG: 50S ribosomal protein L29 [Nitrospinae bacterium]|nr:50S ribosomal protein L29 [Nitrospinota bacterium]
MKFKEIKDLTEDELETKQNEIRLELFNLKFRKSSGQLDNTSRISILKKDLARILTYRNQIKNTQEQSV